MFSNSWLRIQIFLDKKEEKDKFLTWIRKYDKFRSDREFLEVFYLFRAAVKFDGPIYIR